MKSLQSLLTALVVLTSFAPFQSEAQVGKFLANTFFTKKEADFSKMVITYMYVSNIYPAESKTLTAKAMSDHWVGGHSYVGVLFTSKEGSGLIKLDGKVLINGKEALDVGLGTFLLTYETDDHKPKTIEIISNNGQRFTQTITRAGTAKFLSINNQENPSEINLEQDVNLELQLDDNVENLALSMIVGVPGGKDFSPYCLLKPASKVTIPKEAFYSKQVAGGFGDKSILNFKSENYFQIESYKEEILSNHPFGDARIVSTTYDYKPVQLKGKEISKNGITVKGKTGKKQGKLTYYARKENSFNAAPISNLKRIGLASLNVNGVLFKQTTTKSEKEVGNYRYTTVTTTTFQFPQLPTEQYNNLLEKTYNDIQAIFGEYGCSFIDVEQVTNHPNYQNFFVDPNENTETKIQHNYKNARRLLPSTLSETFATNSTTYSKAQPEVQLMNDLNLDALLMVSIDLMVNADSKNSITLDPVITVRLISPPPYIGFNTPSRVFEFTASTFGEAVKKKNLNDPNILSQLTKEEFLMFTLKQALAEIEQLAKNEGYDKVWNLMN